jgi:hypothetical protein
MLPHTFPQPVVSNTAVKARAISISDPKFITRFSTYMQPEPLMKGIMLHAVDLMLISNTN